MENEIQVSEMDERIIDVIRFVLSEGEGRASKLQRKFLWGYNRAGRVMEQLVSLKIIEPPSYIINQKVIVTNEEAEKIIQSLSVVLTYKA